MRLVLVDRLTESRRDFFPLALSRPIWELRCGMTSLADKLVARLRPADVACFVPPYMAEAYRARTVWPVNDLQTLRGDDLFLLDPRTKAGGLTFAPPDAGQAVFADDGQMLCAHVREADLRSMQIDSIESLWDSARQSLPRRPAPPPPVWKYTWELMLANPSELVEDFRAAGRSGIEGQFEQPSVIRGNRNDVYIAPGAKIHPMVVLDAKRGPIYIDEEAEIQPFTRIEGPCYIGRKTILLGAKCREGNSIGPMCRIGGEVEESIIQGHSNKYHDGFLGHAYVGEWVNLGAQTTNSDLKNDYTNVSMVLDGRTPINTGSTKIGSLIGDHAKTSIGTLFNSGAYVGAMSLIVTTGKLVPKFLPSFSWLVNDVITEGFGKSQLFSTARTAMGRRNCQWTAVDEALWNAIYEMTAPDRDNAIARQRRATV